LRGFIYSKNEGGEEVEEEVFKISKSAKLVLDQARFVIKIEGDRAEVIQNYSYTLNIVAIIGLDYDGLVLLEEIGISKARPFRPREIGRTGRKRNKKKTDSSGQSVFSEEEIEEACEDLCYPYNPEEEGFEAWGIDEYLYESDNSDAEELESEILSLYEFDNLDFEAEEVRNEGKRIYIPGREKESELTAEQYQLVAPIVFRLLREIIERRPNQKRLIRTTVIKRRSGKIFATKITVEWQKGWKFSIPAESCFTPDIFWAEFNLNTGVKKYMEMLADSIKACLSGYSVTALQSNDPYKLKGYRLADMKLRRCRISRHLLLEIFSYLPSLNHFSNELAGLLGWNGEESEEKILSEKVFPCPQGRLGNIQIRTFGVKRDFLIFEVCPNG
jgi:hypothetical protein